MLYRVVCGYSQERERIYTAISRADKSLHQDMFWSLKMTHPEIADMIQIGGSMYLNDFPTKLIIFEKIASEYLGIKINIEKEVLSTFRQMQQEGRETSLNNAIKNIESYAEIDAISAVSAQVKEQAQKELRRRRRKEEHIRQERELSPLAPAWLRFQKVYSGD